MELYLRAPTELAHFPGLFRKPKHSSFMFCFRFCVWQLSSQLLVFNSVEILQSCEIIQIQRFASDGIQLLFENEDGTEDMGNCKQNMKLERLGFPKHPGKFPNSLRAWRYTSTKMEEKVTFLQNWLIIEDIPIQLQISTPWFWSKIPSLNFVFCGFYFFVRRRRRQMLFLNWIWVMKVAISRRALFMIFANIT